MNDGDDLRTVLVVEDNPGDAELITDLLTRTPGQQAVVAGSVAAAITALRSQPIDAVLLDLGLPDAEGPACVVALRPYVETCPVVVLTGRDDEDTALDCLAAGAQDYLLKNQIRSDALRRSLGYALARLRETTARRRAETVHRHLAAIVSASQDAIVSSTLDGTIVSWNPGAEVIFGIAAGDAIGRHAAEVLVPIDDAGLEQQRIRLAALAQGAIEPVVTSMRRRRADGAVLHLSATSSQLRDGDGRVYGIAAIFRDISGELRLQDELRRRNAELSEREHELQALTLHVNAAREDERTRIARAVHDELGQLLTGLKMDLRWVTRRLVPTDARDQTLAHKLAEAEQLVDRTVSTVQRIALELRPSALDVLGLAAAIRDEARRFEQRTGIVATTTVDDGEVAPAIATAMYRILQELLTNVARHAHAARLWIDLARADDGWLLRVEDDGRGIDQARTHGDTALGMLGMRERAGALGGSVTFERGPTRGTIATVRIPTEAAGASP